MNYNILQLKVRPDLAPYASVADDVITVCREHLSKLGSQVIVGQTEDDCQFCAKTMYRVLSAMNELNFNWLKTIGTADTVYIAGPMSGYPDFNKPHFWRMEHMLKLRGCKVLTPARHERDDLPYAFYMREGIKMVLQANVVVMLTGWNDSDGANLEYLVANTVGCRICYEA